MSNLQQDIIDVLQELVKEIRKEAVSYVDLDNNKTMKEYYGLMQAERIVRRKIRKYL